jgi:hypothetical protein
MTHRLTASRDELLALRYRQEMQKMLSNLEKKVRLEGRIVAAQWIFLVILTTVFMMIGGWKHQTMTGLWFVLQGMFWFLFGAVFLLMHRFSQLNLALLKEIKQVEVTVLELKQSLQDQ